MNDVIENKVHQLKELSKKQKKLSEIKQDIADILGNANIDEKKKIAEKMSAMPYENMSQARNLQFIVPHVVKELYDHEGPKGEFVIPKKESVATTIPASEPAVEIQEPTIETQEPAVENNAKPAIKTTEPEKKVEPSVRKIEKIEGMVSLDKSKMEALVIKLLQAQKMVKRIERLKISGDTDNLDIRADINISTFLQNIDITMKGNMKNEGDGVVASIKEIRASKFENKVKKEIEKNIGSLGEQIKNFFEREYRQSIEKIQIDTGNMNIYFKKEGIKQLIPTKENKPIVKPVEVIQQKEETPIIKDTKPKIIPEVKTETKQEITPEIVQEPVKKRKVSSWKKLRQKIRPKTKEEKLKIEEEKLENIRQKRQTIEQQIKDAEKEEEQKNNTMDMKKIMEEINNIGAELEEQKEKNEEIVRQMTNMKQDREGLEKLLEGGNKEEK